jgi:copper resistance protein C
MRRLAATVAVLVTAVAGLLVGTGVASAHNVLVGSDPANNASFATAPTSVTFHFDLPVQNFEPIVAVTGPDGKQYQTGTATVNGNDVSSGLSLGPAGAYTAAYRIVSADGHPVTGEIHFTLTAASGGTGASGSADVSAPVTSGSAVETVAPAPVAAGSSGSGGSAWLWIGLVVAALLIAGAAVLLLRKPKQPTEQQ